MTNTQQQIDEPRRNRRTPKGDVSLLACPSSIVCGSAEARQSAAECCQRTIDEGGTAE